METGEALSRWVLEDWVSDTNYDIEISAIGPGVYDSNLTRCFGPFEARQMEALRDE